MPHKFSIGEIVSLRPDRNVPGGIFQVIKQLPPRPGHRCWQTRWDGDGGGGGLGGARGGVAQGGDDCHVAARQIRALRARGKRPTDRRADGIGGFSSASRRRR
jgi:hypothetical protein